MSVMPMRAVIQWEGELRFSARAGRRALTLDGDRREGLSPMETLMTALASCMAIDLVHILGRMRADPTSVSATVEGLRAQSEPRRFTDLTLHFEIAGRDVRNEQVERALALSREKYCSVWHSLNPGIERKITYAVVRDDQEE